MENRDLTPGFNPCPPAAPFVPGCGGSELRALPPTPNPARRGTKYLHSPWESNIHEIPGIRGVIWNWGCWEHSGVINSERTVPPFGGIVGKRERVWKDKREPPGPFPDPGNAALAPWAVPQQFALTFSRNIGSSVSGPPSGNVGWLSWASRAPGSLFPLPVHGDGNSEQENCTQTGQGYPGRVPGGFLA